MRIIWEASPKTPLSKSGRYQLAGVTDVAKVLPSKRFIDRAYPDYRYPSPLAGDANVNNYIQFIHEQQQHGAVVARMCVGSEKQIVLRYDPERYPSFSVRNLVAHGEVWTGVEDSTHQQFPDLSVLKREEYRHSLTTRCGSRIRGALRALQSFSALHESNERPQRSDVLYSS